MAIKSIAKASIVAALLALFVIPQQASAVPERARVDSYRELVAVTTDAASTADATSDWIDTRNYRSICIAWTITGTGDPIGVLYVQTRVGEGNAVDVKLDKVHGTTAAITHTAGNTNIVVNDPPSTVTLIICLDGVPSYVRTFYDRTSGGAAAAIDVVAERKGL